MNIKKTLNVTYYGAICNENYFIFQDDINEAIKRNYNVRLFFSTEGGSLGVAEDMINIINSFPNDIEIFCSEYLLSAGLFIIGNIKRKVNISDSCIGLVHTPSIALESRGTKKKNGFDSFMQKQEDIFNDIYLKNIKCVLTQEELKDVISGEDICIEPERIRKLIRIQQEADL